MKPSELYARPHESVEYNLRTLATSNTNHVPEISESSVRFELLPQPTPPRVEIRVYKDFDFDHRRYWRLASVWLDGKPVMIIQNAGREGDDFCRRFVTDRAAYGHLIGYVHSLIPSPHDLEDSDYCDPDVDIPVRRDGSSVAPYGLTEFYGNSLDGHFERSRY